MNVFHEAIQVLFRDLNLSREAKFVSKTGESKSVRVLTYAPDVYQNVGSSVIETPTLVLEVQVKECPILQPGDQFLIDASTYTVQGEPRRDSARLFWQVDCHSVLREEDASLIQRS